MKNISFFLTMDQVRRRQKDVTRRLGFKTVQVGQLLRGIEKGMGLRRGESIVTLAIVRVVCLRREPLNAMTENLDYGLDECRREGFGDHPTLRWPSEFVRFFCNSHKGLVPTSLVTRIEFEYVDDVS